MAIGTQQIGNFGYGRSRFDNRSGDLSCITARMARSKAAFTALINRRARRMGRREIVAMLDELVDSEPVAGPGLNTLDASSWLGYGPNAQLILDSDTGLGRWLDVDDLVTVADVLAHEDDEQAAATSDAAFDAGGYDEPDDYGFDVPTDSVYGTTLELASNTEEYIANDGFIITFGDFYRRGESGRAA